MSSQDRVAGSKSPPSSFPLFPRLPTELRHEIWGIAAAKRQTIHLLSDVKHPSQEIATINGARVYQPPAALFVNWESRSVAMREQRYHIVTFEMTHDGDNRPFQTKTTLKFCLYVKDRDVIVMHPCNRVGHGPQTYSTEWNLGWRPGPGDRFARQYLLISRHDKGINGRAIDETPPQPKKRRPFPGSRARGPYRQMVLAGSEDAGWYQRLGADIREVQKSDTIVFWDEGPLLRSESDAWPRKLTDYDFRICRDCPRV